MGAAVVGFALLGRYDATPGSPGEPPARWPRDSGVERASTRPTALLFLHPKCPCSRATLSTWERLLAQNQDRLAASVIFVAPQGASEEGAEWAHTDFWRRARSTPGVRVIVDPAGVEARRFSVATSGHVLVYGADGALAFSGGLTPARGHEGPSVGARAVSALARRDEPARERSPVYGCSLADPEACAADSTCDDARSPERVPPPW